MAQSDNNVPGDVETSAEVGQGGSPVAADKVDAVVREITEAEAMDMAMQELAPKSSLCERLVETGKMRLGENMVDRSVSVGDEWVDLTGLNEVDIDSLPDDWEKDPEFLALWGGDPLLMNQIAMIASHRSAGGIPEGKYGNEAVYVVSFDVPSDTETGTITVKYPIAVLNNERPMHLRRPQTVSTVIAGPGDVSHNSLLESDDSDTEELFNVARTLQSLTSKRFATGVPVKDGESAVRMALQLEHTEIISVALEKIKKAASHRGTISALSTAINNHASGTSTVRPGRSHQIGGNQQQSSSLNLLNKVALAIVDAIKK